MKPIIHQYGYYGKGESDLKELFKWLTLNNGLLLDIRTTAKSQWLPHWNKKQLVEALPSMYAHLPEWGNVNYREKGTIKIANPSMGLAKFERLLEDNSPRAHIVVMCACKYYDKCHRKVILNFLASKGYVIDIEPIL